MHEAAARLIDVFLAAFPVYVRAAVDARGWVETDLGEAIDEASEWLRTELTTLLDLPFGDQRRSPLEVTQEATGIVGDALAAAGVEPPGRDPVAVRALPGDIYGLAPASSAELGEEAWEAHIAWGVTKAQAMKPQTPVVAYVGTNLMDRTRLESAASAAGYELTAWSPGMGGAVAGLVDITDSRSDEAIRELADLGVRVIAFGPHVDDIAMARAGALGATEVVPRSRFYARLTDWFPPVV